MSILDKALAAVTPPESELDRAEATRTARTVARPGDWLSLALDHHDMIRAAFDACRRTREPAARTEALKQLALVLLAHAQAEEAVLYPALARAGETGDAGRAYSEQVAAKIHMADLERMEPTSDNWREKLEHIRTAVLHHIYEEENDWFLELKEQSEDDPAFLTARFREEFERYAGSARPVQGEPRSFTATWPHTPATPANHF
ncbi:hemerythrin domain-containing protein [Phenylobacterium sp. LjRoot219]|uniref:hemerythrin domain-containing protein n=1 Tax=Phenylobacterium sp. LjRoot219 TaxID=3342283 RepID=UPI003ED118D4